MGSTNDGLSCRMLKVDRTQTSHLVIEEDEKEYQQNEVKEEREKETDHCKHDGGRERERGREGGEEVKRCLNPSLGSRDADDARECQSELHYSL